MKAFLWVVMLNSGIELMNQIVCLKTGKYPETTSFESTLLRVFVWLVLMIWTLSFISRGSP